VDPREIFEKSVSRLKPKYELGQIGHTLDSARDRLRDHLERPTWTPSQRLQGPPDQSQATRTDVPT
jgi:hypothetical protein